MDENNSNRRPRLKVAREEDVDATVSRLISGVLELTEESSRGNRSQRRLPSLVNSTEQWIRSTLEDEIVPAIELAEDSSIREAELEREVIKKALIGLKLPTIRDIAENRRLSTAGKSEDLVTRIAASYNWDETEIAKLVLDSLPQRPLKLESGHSSRIFTFRELPDVEQIKERLSFVAGRYIRTGVAKWFVFDAVTHANSKVTLEGSLRTYSATVDPDKNGVAQLHSRPQEAATSVDVDNQGTFVVRNSNISTSRAAMNALEIASGSESLRYLPLADTRAKGIKGTVHPSTLFLLDLLYTSFKNAALSDTNLSVARFKVGKDEEPVGDSEVRTTDSEKRPMLRAVRLEGEHLVDSVPACRLIMDGRPLTEIAATVSTTKIDSETKRERVTGRFPVHISLENDHVHVFTGYGTGAHEESVRVHAEILSAVRFALSSGPHDSERLDNLISKISLRAADQTGPKTADILD